MMTGRTIKTMEYTLKVISIKPGERHEGEVVERWLDVAFEIYGDGEVVAERAIGLQPDADSEEVKVALAKYLETYKSDIEVGEKSKEAGIANANAIKVAKDLDGFEIQ